MYEKMTMREWSNNTTPTSTQAPGLLSLVEPVNNGETIVSICCELGVKWTVYK
jgi:hypothetical protein